MIAVLLMACASRSARAGGVTVITHGYESVYFGYPGWVDSMGDQVAAAAEAKGLTTSRYHLVIGHTLLAGPYQTLDATSSNLASGADEVIVTVDWAAWADHLDPAYGSHVNTADIAAILATDLLATLPSRGISSPLASRPLHLIGHSRGASVMMETARILGSSGIWVDHLTTLDPHPLTGWDLALKPDPPAHLYENVIFADNYWRDGGIVNGQQIVGAEDLQLADSLGHSDVHTWYHGTIGISGSYPLDDGETPVLDSWYADPYPARDQIGFFYSRIANGSYFLFSPDFSYAIGTQFGGGVTREVSSRGGGAQWANIGNIKIQGHSGNGIPQGQPITATYKYQDRDSQVRIDWFVDSDANPGNLPLVSQTRDSTGDKADNSSVTIFTDSLAIGTWRLRAKITSLNYNNTVRYEYADNPFSITYPDFVLKGIAPDSIEAGAGVTRLTLQGSSFGPSDKVLFSNGTSTTTVTPLSIMSDQIVVDFDFGTTVRTWDIAVRQYLDDIPLRTSASRAVAVASSSPNGPSITQQPADATLTFGQTNTFSVAATGSGTLSYQWKRNNLSIAGATSASFTTSAVAYANDGFTYRVFVTDDTGTTSSRLATLHVVAPTIAITDPSEPNDSPTQATALPLGVPTNGLIASTTDVDWYIVTLPTRGQLNVKLAVPPGLDYDIELYSSDLTLMAGSYNQAGENEAIQIPDAFGVYYVRVYGYPEGHGAYSQSQPYQLTATTAVDLPPGPLSGAITSAVMWSGVVNVSGDVTINGGGSLTILPGTQVRCVGGDSQATGADSNRVEIIVNGGTLNAVGTSDAPITFTSAGAVKRPGDWYGIRVRDGDVALQNCVVEYAVEGIRFENTDNRFFTYSLSGVTVQRCSGDGVWTTSGQFALPVVLDNFKLFYNVTGLNASGPVTLTGGQVSNNSGYGISAGTLVATNASVTRNGNIGISCSTATLTNCTVSENTGKGVSCGGAATLTDCTLNQNIGTGVTCGGNSTLTRCTAMSNQGDGVYGSAAMTIDHCTLSHNTGWGLNVNPRSWPGPYAADIWDSMMQSNGSGGAVLGTEAVVGLVNNVIVGNGGVGLYLNLSTYNCSGGEGASGITGNSIHDNGGAGVLVQGNQPPVLTISGNDIYQNTAFELRNESDCTVVANDNYWGEPTNAELGEGQANLSRIYDIRDGASQAVMITEWYAAPLGGGSPGAPLKLAYPVANPVSGTIDTTQTWSGTVLIVGDVTVTGHLTIAPGTTVLFDYLHDTNTAGLDRTRCELILDEGGTLSAVGTSDALITFTSAGAVKKLGDWYGIRVKGGDVALENCVVEYASEGIRFESADTRFNTYSLSNVTVQRCSGDGVWATSGQFARPVVLNNFKLFYNVTGLNASGPVEMSGGEVTHNSGNGITAGTLVATNTSVTRNGNIGISCSTATLTNCTVSDNTGKGVSCGGAATLTDCTLNQNIGTGVTCGGNSTLTRCTAMSNQGDGVYGSAAMTIDHCTLSHNTGWGLNVNPRSWPGPYAVDIWDSMMQSNGSGGAALGTEAVVGLVNNVIVGNGGVGLYLNLSTYNCSGGEGASGITGNSIHDNGGAGVLVQGNQPPVLTLSGNDIYQNTAFELRNESGIPIVANNNYWGNPTTSEINASQVNLSRIYDWNDNASYGHVSIQGIRNTTILQAPQIISQPQSIAAQSSESVTLSVSCTGTDPITYQWYQNGNPIAQATASELVLGYLDAGKAGSYQVVATNVAGSATSAAALVTLILPPAMPEIVRQPVSQTVVVGASVNLTVIATGTAPLTYQWCRNGTPIAAAASATLNLASARVNDAAVYTVTVSNSAGSVTSQPATLTVNMIEGTTIARQILRSGTIYTVTVMVVPPVGTPAYLVEEVVPAGFTVGNISNLGGFDVTNSRVTWGPFWDGMPRTLVYTLESPAGFSGTVAINGMALFYGATAATAGDTTITIAPPLVTARLEMGEFYGYYTVSIFGAVGSTYVLEASDNMQDPWEEIGTLKLNTSPRVFVDLDSPTKSQRFYRAKWVK